MKKVTTNSFIKNANEIHSCKYDYSLVDYINAKTKVKIICSIHGVFEQTPNNHLMNKGCRFCCGNILSTKNEFIEKANIKHNYKYDYSLVEYVGANIKIKIICPIHGVFEQTPYNHLKGNNCLYCTSNLKLTKNEFIEKANIKHNYKYDYSLVEYVNTKTSVRIICPEHGVFNQKAQNHLRGDKCPSCHGNKKLTDAEFIKKSKATHGDKYNYSLVQYFNNSTNVKIICKKHGEFLQNPNNHLNGNGCPICKESKGEKEITKYLNNNNIKFTPQHKFTDCKHKNKLPFDFYLPNYNTCIEFNGRQHYTPIYKWGGVKNLLEIQKRDKIKIEYCQNNNIPLIIIKYDEIIKDKLINIKT